LIRKQQQKTNSIMKKVRMHVFRMLEKTLFDWQSCVKLS